MSKQNAHNTLARKRCAGVRRDGSACKLSASPGSKYCFWHDPSRSAERLVAQSKGGSRGLAVTLPPETADIKVRTADEVVGLLSLTINHVRTGQIDPKVANAIGYLAGIVLRAREQGEIDERLKRLEDIVTGGRKRSVTTIRPTA